MLRDKPWGPRLHRPVLRPTGGRVASCWHWVVDREPRPLRPREL